MATNDRPKVGPADPETRRKMLRQKLDEPSRSEGVAQKPKPKAKAKKGGALQEVKDALDPAKKRQRREGMKGKTLDQVVSEAVDGAPKRDDNE